MPDCSTHRPRTAATWATRASSLQIVARAGGLNYAWWMRKTLRPGRAVMLVIAAAVMCAGSLEQAHAQYRRTPSEWVGETGAHKIAGAVTLGLAATTAILGALEVEDVHPAFAYATLASSAVTVSLGTIGYGKYWKSVWPHPLMNMLAVTGYALTAFVLEPGSPEHIATGATSVGLMCGAVLYIALR